MIIFHVCHFLAAFTSFIQWHIRIERHILCIFRVITYVSVFLQKRQGTQKELTEILTYPEPPCKHNKKKNKLFYYYYYTIHAISNGRNICKVFLHLLPPFALKLSKISVKSAISKGADTAMNGHFRSPSSLSAINTWYTKMGSTVNEFPMAELIADLRCCGEASDVRRRMPQNIMLYKTPLNSNKYIICYCP